ncbi:hypothetical protein D3C74_276060 [compost metagenome]
MSRSGTCRVQHLYKPLEGYILMFIRIQTSATDPFQKLTESRVAQCVDTKHQRVDKQAHEMIQSLCVTSRYRAAHRDIRSCTQSG